MNSDELGRAQEYKLAYGKALAALGLVGFLFTPVILFVGPMALDAGDIGSSEVESDSDTEYQELHDALQAQDGSFQDHAMTASEYWSVFVPSVGEFVDQLAVVAVYGWPLISMGLMLLGASIVASAVEDEVDLEQVNANG